jgi:hypothetical protein
MDRYIIANHKCSGFHCQVVSLTEEELNKWIIFFQKRDRTATSWDDDCFEIWECNKNSLGYAKSLKLLKYSDYIKEYHKPKNLIETMLAI